jgi:hypothetical protein
MVEVFHSFLPLNTHLIATEYGSTAIQLIRFDSIENSNS